MKRLVGIRSYKLKAGATAAFQNVFATTAVPLLREWGTDVVAFGPSPHQAGTYFLIRSYASHEDLQVDRGFAALAIAKLTQASEMAQPRL